LGVEKFCPNSKFPDKRMYGLTSEDCITLIPINVRPILFINFYIYLIFHKNKRPQTWVINPKPYFKKIETERRTRSSFTLFVRRTR
jgi:hypothetical protein